MHEAEFLCQQGFLSFLSLRGSTLEQGVRSMLNDPAGERLARQVYAHPLVTSLAKPSTLDRILRRTPRPPYLPASVFSAALMDSIVDTVGVCVGLALLGVDGEAE